MEEKQIKNNMELYEKFCNTPKNAQKSIQAGRLKGMTDINPMFRIKSLTEQFGPVGFGWYYEITKQWLEPGADGVISAFVNIDLYVKLNEEWSKPIQGTGGSTFVAKEKNGLYTDDEAYKKALTDAISIACKSLGMCADIYYSKDARYGTKYDIKEEKEEKEENKYITAEQIKKFAELGITAEAACAYNKVDKLEDILFENAKIMILKKEKALKQNKEQ